MGRRLSGLTFTAHRGKHLVYADEADGLAAGPYYDIEAKKAGAYLATHFAQVATNEMFWRTQPTLTFQNNMRKHLREAVEKFSASDAQTVAQAERDMTRRIAKRERKQGLNFIWIGIGVGLFVSGVAAFIDLIGTLAFGVFPMLRLFGIRVVNRVGAPVSRLHLLARWLLVWPPIIVALIIVSGFAHYIADGDFRPPIAVLGVGISLALILALDAAFIYAVLRPSAGLQDRLSRTRLVPL